MTKFNFFLVVEALLLTLGLITIFNNDIIRFIFILVLTLLAVRFFNKESKSDFVARQQRGFQNHFDGAALRRLDDLLDFTFFGFHVEYLCGSCYLSGCGLCHD